MANGPTGDGPRNDWTNRRRLLSVLGSVAAVGLAGCSGDGPDGGGSGAGTGNGGAGGPDGGGDGTGGENGGSGDTRTGGSGATGGDCPEASALAFVDHEVPPATGADESQARMRIPETAQVSNIDVVIDDQRIRAEYGIVSSVSIYSSMSDVESGITDPYVETTDQYDFAVEGTRAVANDPDTAEADDIPRILDLYIPDGDGIVNISIRNREAGEPTCPDSLVAVYQRMVESVRPV